MTTLHTVRGANFWSRRPVTRMDIAPGAYDDISSAESPGFADALHAALPGLIEHRCSIGARGGFLTRLARGTYAPHIIEHVALELQLRIGHRVGYGKTRDGDVPGEYTVIFEHLHSAVGLRAAELALEIVRRAFAGTLESAVDALAELHALARAPDAPPVQQHVRCGITGGMGRHEARDELLARGFGRSDLVVDVAPASLLHAGLPYARSDAAIILDATPLDVPERFREPERARLLVSVLADAVTPGGIAIVPAMEWDVQHRARRAGCRLAVFATQADVTATDTPLAYAAARVHGGRIVLERQGVTTDGGDVRQDTHIAAQVAAALAGFALGELEQEPAITP